MRNAWRFVWNRHGRNTLAFSTTTAASAFLGLHYHYRHNDCTTFCGATDQDIPPIVGSQEGREQYATQSSLKSKVHEEWYHGMFPTRQLWRPKFEYPLWDPDWDHKHNDDLSSEEKRNLRVKGVTRHIILVRHGQYDESYRVSAMKLVTTTVPLCSWMKQCRLRVPFLDNSHFSLYLILGRRKTHLDTLGKRTSRVDGSTFGRHAPSTGSFHGLSHFIVARLQYDTRQRNGRYYCQTHSARTLPRTRSRFE